MNAICRRWMPAMLLLAIASDQALGQFVSQGYLSGAAARRIGLKSVWNKQIASSLAYGTISDIFQFVSADSYYNIHKITANGRTILISERGLDRHGNLLGKDQAAYLAKQTVVSLKEGGHDPEHVTRQVPEVMLYLTSSDAMVHAIDAETGRKIWSATVGKPGYPTLRPAANEKILAVISGSSLYLLRRSSGEIYWKERLTGVPAAGPAVSDQMVFTMASNGLVEAFRLDELDKAPLGFQSMGRGRARPRVSTGTVSWSTELGHLYVGDALLGKVKYRLEADGAIRTQPAFAGSKGLVTSTVGGLVYGLDRLSGEIQWRTTTGRDSHFPPVVVGDGVYILSEPSGMSRLHTKTGERQWWVTGITQFLAVSKERIYCLDDRQRLLLLNIETGAVVGATSARGIELALANWQTDRILMGTNKGRIQYFREQALDTPLIHVKLYPSPKHNEEREKTADSKRETRHDDRDDKAVKSSDDGSDLDTEDAAEDGNPFEFDGDAADDPFGSDDDDNPFG